MKPIESALCSAALAGLSASFAGCLNNHHVSHGLVRSDTGVIDLKGGAVEISDSFSAEDSMRIAEGSRAVMAVLRKDRFTEWLRRLEEDTGWPLTLATSPTDDCEPIKPQDIVQHLTTYVENGGPLRVDRMGHQYWRAVRGTTAATGVCDAISTFCHVAGWWEEPHRRANLVNTLAHEMTHLLPSGRPSFTCTDEPARFLITDDEHQPCSAEKCTCDDAFLASYTFGDLVQCFHESYSPATDVDVEADKTGFSNFEVCYDTTINGSRLAGLQRSGLKPSTRVSACTGRR